MSIPTIEIEEVSVQEVYVPNWIQQQPTVDYLVPPVVLNIGNPIVNMPVVSKHIKIINIIKVAYLLIKIL